MTEKRPRGRPTKPAGEKRRDVLITLSPQALALIDAQPGPRSTLIEALIIGAYS
ncbi:hypothetical protein [Novosphingobium sp. FSW06-99]|uniref:hypothetical protein n=1 Tax=Novosphingobium sp. FSW06-99 TaxID=1739113 RepID=UPI001E3317D2|nr:hypothetical protein [Novosphingobium sp. FSW06-99]